MADKDQSCRRRLTLRHVVWSANYHKIDTERDMYVKIPGHDTYYWINLVTYPESDYIIFEAVPTFFKPDEDKAV